MKKLKAKYETELYGPLKDFFEGYGYEVHGEVKNCDLIALKDDEIVALELKLKFSLKLVYQCLERKTLSPCVYAVIETPKGGIYSKESKRMINLLKRIEVGLFCVSFYESGVKVDKILDPVLIPIRHNTRKKKQLLKEIDNRSGSYNVGGSKGPHISAFREASIHVAAILSLHGQMSAKSIKEIGGPEKTSSILIQNYYGWFAKVERGVYKLDEMAYSYLKTYPHIFDFYRDKYIEDVK